MKPLLRFLPLLCLSLLACMPVMAQGVVRGRVTEAETGEALPGASVVVKGTTRGTSTDLDGQYSLQVPSFPTTLVFSFIGHEAQEIAVQGAQELNVTLQAGLELEDVLVVGSRFAPRTAITTPVPIDNIKATELLATGQITFDKMLTYTVPAFNSTNQTVSDATAHFDPADLRGLGPSRTLVLVNGKRKNPSSLVYINDTPGKGEVGVDMKSIPAAAIARIEVLRDGASAQYGSDAIAGVINIILKEDVDYTDVNVFTGITTEGDGLTAGYNINTGFQIGDRGFFNVTHSFADQEETNRAGTPGQDDLFGVGSDDSFIQAHPDLGMRVGQPNMTTGDVFFNSLVRLTNEAELYGFGGLTFRKGLSYALYRTPYWIPDPFFIHHRPGELYEGFHPTFETDILDNSLVVGVRGIKKGWDFDLSNNQGGNRVDYTVDNSLNRALEAQSPTTFRAGGYRFAHNVTNLDLGRQFGNAALSFGSEFRTENFQAVAGEEASYAGQGAQSFPGLQPQNEVDAFRYNIGFYADLGVDVDENLFVGGAARYENYSDFGDNFSWKANARYKFSEDRATLRAAVSTGFRAPSLHQIYLSIIQTLVSGGTVSNQGTFNNISPVLRQLEVGQLKDETALNFTAGAAFRPIPGLYLSADFYQVDVDDRIVYSSSIATSNPTTTVFQVLQQFQITSLKFFINAVDTRSRGVDFVANYTWDVPGGELAANLAANVNDTEIRGQIDTPDPIRDAGVNIFDRKEQSRLLSARPDTKFLLGFSYNAGPIRATLNNTRFGAVIWQHADDPGKDQTFDPRLVTDAQLEYTVTDNVRVGVSVNNLFNVYPEVIDPKGDPVTDLGGRFRYPWEVNQFGFNGTTVTGNLNVRF